MKITEVRNHWVKIHPHSITLKDNLSNTRGVIKATRFKELPPRDQLPLWKTLKDSGLWNSGNMDFVYVVDGQLYYLYEQSADEYYKNTRYAPDMEEPIMADIARDMDHKYEARQKFIAKVAAQGITVIPCKHMFF